MGLDTSGNILEGVRVSPSNSVFTFPPRSIVSGAQQDAFNSLTSRREYCVWISCAGASGFTIENPDLVINWARNDLITRFSWDPVFRKWLPSPGSGPQILGKASNETRLKAEIPFLGGTSSLYFGLPKVSPKLSVQVVATASDFVSNLSKGTVQVAQDSLELNFSPFDITDPTYDNSSVCFTSDSFFDRSTNDGSVETFPESGLFDAYLNPIPPVGSIPRLRLGFGPYLTIESVDLDSDVYEPSVGVAVVSYESGYVRLHPEDARSKTLYYEGVSQGQSGLTKLLIGSITPSGNASLIGSSGSLVGVPSVDQENVRFLAFADGETPYYLNTKYSSVNPEVVSSGIAWVNTASGNVFLGGADTSRLSGRSLYILDTYANIDDVASVAFRRSAVNGVGAPTESDFHEFYTFDNETVSSNLRPAPFISIPTRPIDEDNLSYSVVKGVGKFVGTLNRVSEIGIPGYSWDLDFKDRQITLYNRASSQTVIDKPSDTINLPHPIINETGFDYSVAGGVPSSVSESIDLSSGQVKFERAIGEDSKTSYASGIGNISNSIFTSVSGAFSQSDVSRTLIIYSGTQAGAYKVIAYVKPEAVRLAGTFRMEPNVAFVVRDSVEYLVENIWRPDPAPIKNFSIETSDNYSGPYVSVSDRTYSIVGDTVKFSVPPSANKIVRINYQYYTVVAGKQVLKSATQYYAVEIVNEVGTLSRNILVGFNSQKNMIAQDREISVSINGSVLESSQFRADLSNDRIILAEPARSSDYITVSYFIYEYDPTNRVIILDNTNVFLDTTKFVEKSKSIELDGDYSSSIPALSFFKIEQDIYEVASSTYDSAKQVTTVTFKTGIRVSFQGDYLVASAVNFEESIRTTESLYQNDVEVTLPGYHKVRTEALIKLSSFGQSTEPDIYQVNNSSYDSDADQTVISLNRSAIRTYIAPITVSYSTGSIFTEPRQFFTENSLILDNPHSVFRIGKNPKKYVLDVDYQLQDGGQIDLISPVVYGDKLVISYSSRYFWDTGTEVTASYYYKIVPTSANGLVGQDLKSNYRVYWPESYFFRIETVESYLPDLLKEVKSESSANSTSGPVSSYSVTSTNADQGFPSLYFNEQKYNNLDIVTRRVLKYYNEVTDLYENVLSNYDGRVVGGNNGRLLYDGSHGAVRANVTDITNQIDDVLQLSSVWSWSSFSLVDRFRTLYSPSRYSRIFPTNANVNVQINADVGSANNGKVIGNLGRTDITKSRNLYSALATCRFTNSLGTTANCVYDENAAQGITPPFIQGMNVYIYDRYGNYLGLNQVVSVSSEFKPLKVYLLNPLTVSTGSIVSYNQFENAINRFYRPETDIEVNEETGDLINTESTFLQALNIQREVFANEILTTNVSFSYSDTAPYRFPALDGSINTDNGLLPAPIQSRDNELEVLTEEVNYFNAGTWKLTGTVTSQFSLLVENPTNASIGKVYRFDDGPNVSVVFTVSSRNGSAYGVSQALVVDSTTRTFRDISAGNDIATIIAKYAPVLTDNSSENTTPLCRLDSLMKTFASLNYAIGTEIGSGTGTLSGRTITNSSIELPDETSHYIYISEGINTGVYSYTTSGSTAATIDSLGDKGIFQSGDIEFKVMEKDSFWSFDSVKAVGLLGNTCRNFSNRNATFLIARSYTDLDLRLSHLVAHREAWSTLLDLIDTVLKNTDSLYDRRYLWIKQRTDRKSGLIYKRQYAGNLRRESTQKLIESQQKQKAIENL